MFEITIIEKKTVTKVVKGGWGVIGKEPLKKQQVDDLQYSHSILGDRVKDVDAMQEVRGYLPDRQEPVVETREVLKQQVEDIDLAAVIKAVNKL